MSYNLLENSDTAVFWEIPPGKPNPHEAFPGIGIQDRRSRVDAAGQKNETCTYYAFNFFRPRIGKLSDSDPELRRVEKLFSDHRKRHTLLLNQMDRDIRIITSILLQVAGQPISEYSDIAKDEKLKLLQKLAAEGCDSDYSEHILNNHANAIISLNEELLRDLSFDINEFTQTFLRKVRLAPEAYDMLPVRVKQVVSSSAITFARLQHYPQLTMSHWKIQDGPQALMEEIREFGPICVRGYYGDHYYPEGAQFTLKNKLCGHTVSAWKPNSRLESPKSAGAVPTHSVVVVGLLKNEANKFFVLFIDPRDESKLARTRKIYQLSYDGFIKYMGTLYGVPALQYCPTPGEDTIVRYTKEAGESVLNYCR